MKSHSLQATNSSGQQLRWSALALATLLAATSASDIDEGTQGPFSSDGSLPGFDAFTETVTASKDGEVWIIESDGLPAHQMMVGITNWQQQVPVPQSYRGANAWRFPADPKLADTPVSGRTGLFRGAIALAVNGVPIFNALNNRGDDALLAGELDEFGGHCGRADDYHYHVAPLHLEDSANPASPIAYALDGFAIYGSKETDGSVVQGLDEYNGHLGPKGIYHYHGTTTYPYINGGLVGEVRVTDQVEPQPRTPPFRPAGRPLRGAVITDFVDSGDGSYRLEYKLGDEVHAIAYTVTAKDVALKFIDPDGSVRTEDYPVQTAPKKRDKRPEYAGTGHVTQGPGEVLIENLFASQGRRGRIAAVGQIRDMEGGTWTLPADNRFSAAPKAADLYNETSGVTPAGLSSVDLDAVPVFEVDPDGEVVTGYLFADNYFELYINGQLLAVDPVPFTPFNSNVVRFRVKRPYTIAVLLIDWEENLGLGSEANRGKAYHPGDGGFIASFSDGTVTNADWKAQTFYTAPIQDLGCLREVGSQRLSDSCNSDSVADGSAFFGVHWRVPKDAFKTSFNDAEWPTATTYTEKVIGVDNKPSYMNFRDQFSGAGGEFIWSTNVVLDNEVIVRYTVE